MSKYFAIFILSALSFSALRAQDPHFSQYHASPLTLNPAMTGFFNEDFRFSGNYRQQWWSGGSPFTTTTVSFDTKMMQTKIKENDVFSLGLLGLYDQSLGGGFKSTDLAVSLAYHKSFDGAGNNNLGLGFQCTYATRSISADALTFADQFTGNGFDTNIPSNETFSKMIRNYLDINTGLLYNYKNDKMELYVGTSVYHVNRPKTNFINGDDYRLPIRYTVHAGARINSGEDGNAFYLGGLFMQQAGATEKIAGLAYGFSINTDAEVIAGSWYRIGEGIIPYAGINYNNFRVGVSYDVINSDIKINNPKNGSFELSFSILGKRPTNPYTNYKKGRIF